MERRWLVALKVFDTSKSLYGWVAASMLEEIQNRTDRGVIIFEDRQDAEAFENNRLSTGKFETTKWVQTKAKYLRIEEAGGFDK